MLSGNHAFVAGNPAFKNVVAVEPRLYALYQSRRRFPEGEMPANDAGFYFKAKAALVEWVKAHIPPAIIGVETPPTPLVPALIVEQSGATDAERDGEVSRSTALAAFVAGGGARVHRASLPGAGPFDYTDIPEKYPLMSALTAGQGKRDWTTNEVIKRVARLITEFVKNDR
jgi:hypothetical protein